MDYLVRLNDAIEYIESNLDSQIDYTKAANLAYCSVSYFQRVFSFIAGISLSEYIRRRRLTLAAFELQNSCSRIIDIALKYGYESPDSFSRAFMNLHGILPSMARNEGVSLKAYPRIAFHLSIQGDAELKYRIERKKAFRIVGITRHFRAPENDEHSVPVFWDEVYTNGMYSVIDKLSNGVPGGVHGFLQVYNETRVDYTIASITDKDIPDGLNQLIVPASTWAIFEVNGSVGTAMADVWRRIFTEWFPTSNYRHAETMEIECFPYDGDKGAEDYRFELWIPVVRNS
ncbi:MAG TPA: AraC family transcriptional regulator [Lachnospiraceae bacterium]|nr:AraC family transcriptional regulator [Lachnospiraceae bacterium]